MIKVWKFKEERISDRDNNLNYAYIAISVNCVPIECPPPYFFSTEYFQEVYTYLVQHWNIIDRDCFSIEAELYRRVSSICLFYCYFIGINLFSLVIIFSFNLNTSHLLNSANFIWFKAHSCGNMEHSNLSVVMFVFSCHLQQVTASTFVCFMFLFSI